MRPVISKRDALNNNPRLWALIREYNSMGEEIKRYRSLLQRIELMLLDPAVSVRDRLRLEIMRDKIIDYLEVLNERLGKTRVEILETAGVEGEELIKEIMVEEGLKEPEVLTVPGRHHSPDALKECVNFILPRELIRGEMTTVRIVVENRFDRTIENIIIDLSELSRHFTLSEEKVVFPSINPGERLEKKVFIRPLSTGDFEFTVRISSNLGETVKILSIRVEERSILYSLTSPSTFPLELFEMYEFLELIGQGGFAWVYRARRKRDGKVVALKIPKNLDTATGKAFLREIRNWLHLKHPNIVELYDANVLPIPYLEMEYCESSLEKLPKPMEIKKTALLIFNIAEGLKYAHSKGIIHRDLKPSNILLKHEIPKITDWGLSKVISETRSSTTLASFTPYYVAPEQLDRTFGVTDERTDIWQLGVIFYELVTGGLPFEGDTMAEVLFNIIRRNPVPPTHFSPEAKLVESIIMRMLAKRKEERYESVEELQRDLAKVLNMTYSESLKESKTLGDVRRAVYYLTELLLINLKTNNAGEAYKYASDLVFYAKGELREEVQKLAEQVKFRLEEGLDVPPELVEKAEIIIHKIRLGFKKL